MGAVAGIEHRRRRNFLDDRRPGDFVAGEQRLAPPHRAFGPAGGASLPGLEISLAAAASRFFRRLGSALRRARQFRRVDQPGRCDPETDDLDRRAGIAVAETACVLGVERRRPAPPIPHPRTPQSGSAVRRIARHSACRAASRSAGARWAPGRRRAGGAPRRASARTAPAPRPATDRGAPPAGSAPDRAANRRSACRARTRCRGSAGSRGAGSPARAPGASRASARRRRTAPASGGAGRGRARPKRRGCRAPSSRSRRGESRQAASKRSRPSGSAMRVAIARLAASASSANSPPSRVSQPSRPSTRLASVTVGSSPPWP